MSKKDFMSGLNSLLEGNNDEIKQESNKTLKPVSKKAINIANHKEIKSESIKIADKEKATFNLSKTSLRKLEDAWIEIRKLRGDKKVSKTDIVEYAISSVIEDFELKKEASQLYRNIASNKAIKQ